MQLNNKRLQQKVSMIILLIVITVCNVLPTMADDAISPDSIKISLSSLTMAVGETRKIQVSISPSNAEGYELEYTSSNPAVLTAAIGTVIANAEGTADLTVRVAGTEISDTVTVTVKTNTVILVSSIILSENKIYLERYHETKISYSVNPENAANKNIQIKSLDTSVATVDDNGYVYGVKTGSTIIKLTSEDGNATAELSVIVEGYDDYSDDDNAISVRSVTIYDGEDEASGTVEVMRTQTKQFSAVIYPESATDKRIRWRSADEDIATIDENGILTGITEGSVNIYAISRDSGRQDVITVNIVPYVRKPDSISIIPPENPSYETGNRIMLKAALLPLDTTETCVHWLAYGANASIDNNGNLTLNDRGKVEVKAYTSDYKQSATLTIDVKYSPDHFILVKESIGVKQDRAIIMTFDKDVDAVSSVNNIFVTSDADGNGDKTEIDISVQGNKVCITPKEQWPLGENYAFIKGNLRDTDGACIVKNYKYKFVTRSVNV